MKKTLSKYQKIRKDLDLTQVQLAKRLGVTQGAISNWERGISAPAKDVREKLKVLVEKRKNK